MSCVDDNDEWEKMDEDLPRSNRESSSDTEDENMDIKQIEEGDLNNEMDMNEGHEIVEMMDEAIREDGIQEISLIDEEGRGGRM